MKSVIHLSSAILLVILLLAGTTIAQQEAPVNNFQPSDSTGSADNVLRVESELVLIDVSVLDNKRNFIPDLDKSNFHVYEDKVEQQIEIFSKERAPVSIGFVIDTSGSMRFKLKTVIEAAKKMLEMCKPGDEVFIVDMKDSLRIRFAQPYTTNIEEVKDKFKFMYPSGGTALLDGIAEAGKYAQKNAANRRRALIVLSDGDDRDSTIKTDDLVDQMREQDVQVYLIGFPEGYIGPDGAFLEMTSGKAKGLMKKIAEESGGQAFFPESLEQIGEMTVKIGKELTSQYTIGYYPNSDNGSNWRKLQVKLSDKDRKYVVRTRKGYFGKKELQEARTGKQK
jgi:Ca-activated chloride channel homolog